MPAPKNDLEARIAALETQISTLMNNSAIRAYLDVDRDEAAFRAVGKAAAAREASERDAAERELQAASVVWIEATATPRAKPKYDGQVGYLEWSIGKNQHARLGVAPHGGRIQMRADAWAARLAREPELAALVEATEIATRELPRDEAIDLERRARAEERR